MKKEEKKELPPLVLSALDENANPSELYDSILSQMESEKKVNEWLKKANKVFVRGKNNLISLKDFILTINKIYFAFKEEYDNLEKMNIGNDINVLSYNNESGRQLYLKISDVSCDAIVPKGFNYLLINEDMFKNIQVFAFDNELFDQRTFYLNSVNEEVLRGYLDLFDKYCPLFDLYQTLKNDYCINSKHSQYLYLKLIANDNSLVNGLDGVIINIQNYAVLSSNYKVSIYVDLTNGIKIDCHKSEVRIDGMTVPSISQDFYNNVLDNIKIDLSRIEINKIDEYIKEAGYTKVKK